MAASYPDSSDLLRYDGRVTTSHYSDCSKSDGSPMVDAMTDEDERAARLLDAQANAIALFDEVAARGLVAPGQGEQAVSDQVRDLANEMFGKTRHWHKRIIRSGPHTLVPYRETPPDRIIEGDASGFAAFGAIFGEFEAGPGPPCVLGRDPAQHRLAAGLPVIFG